MKIHWDVEQGSVEWHKLRRGIPTASEAHRIITPARGELASAQDRYICELVAERLLNWLPGSIEQLDNIKRGREQEGDAIFAFEQACNVDTRRVGFVTTDDGRFGASPDRLIMGEPMIPMEVKCPSDIIELEYLLFGLGNNYKCQVQSQIWVMGSPHAAFFAYNVKIPKDFRLWTQRDEPFIAKLSDAIQKFNDRLDQMTELARSWGVWEEYVYATVHDRELDDGIRRAPLTTEQELADLIEKPMAAHELHRGGA